MVANSLIPIGQEGSTFEYYRQQVYAVADFSRISIQTVDPSAYPMQLKILERFVADMRDVLYGVQQEKVGRSVEEIEKIDARLCLEVGNRVKMLNNDLNNVHGLAQRYPMLVQNKGRPLKRKRRLDSGI